MNDQRLIVISQPKAGTYLAEKIFNVSGYQSTHLNLGEQTTWDYKGADLNRARNYPDAFMQGIRLADAVTAIPERSVSVGHLPYSDESAKALEGFRKVLLVREMRAALISYYRFCVRYKRTGYESQWLIERTEEARLREFVRMCGPGIVRHAERIFEWSQHGARPFFFSQLKTVDGVRELLDYIPVVRTVAHDDRILAAALESDTITKMPPRSCSEWGPSCEEIFQEIGGGRYNQMIGVAES